MTPIPAREIVYLPSIWSEYFYPAAEVEALVAAAKSVYAIYHDVERNSPLFNRLKSAIAPFTNED